MKITVALALGLAVGVMSKSDNQLQKTIKKLSEPTEKEVKTLANKAIDTIVGTKKSIADKAQIKVNAAKGAKTGKAGKRRRARQRAAKAAAKPANEVESATNAALPQSMLAQEIDPTAGEEVLTGHIHEVAEKDGVAASTEPKQFVFTPLEVAQLSGASSPCQSSEEAVEGQNIQGCDMKLTPEQEEQLRAVMLNAVQVSTPEKPLVLTAQDQELLDRLNQAILEEEQTEENVVVRTVVTVIAEAKNPEKPEEEPTLVKAQLGSYAVLNKEESEPALEEVEGANPPVGSYRVKVALVGLNQ